MTLRLDRTSLQRGGRLVANDITCAIEPGKLTALLGPNGAGKSTVLSLLAGTLVPGHGQATLDGRSLTHYASEDLARRRTVMVQSGDLKFPFSVHEVVRLGRLPFGRTDAASEDRIVENALLQADALSLADRLYTELSGGERQRVRLARAIAQAQGDPAIDATRYLLLDEPTSNLDLAHQKRTLQVAQAMAQKGLGILAVLHDLNLAAAFADRILVLERGCLVSDGDPWEVTDPALIEQVFGVAMTRSQCPVSGRPALTPVFHDHPDRRVHAAE